MVLDSSAIVAIEMREAGFERLLDCIEQAPVVVVCTATILEATMVLTSKSGSDARPIVAAFMRNVGAEIIPFRQDHLELASAAFLRFGKGRNKASLNYCDCISYAVAVVADLPLLFVGNDFIFTDIRQAMPGTAISTKM